MQAIIGISHNVNKAYINAVLDSDSQALNTVIVGGELFILGMMTALDDPEWATAAKKALVGMDIQKAVGAMGDYANLISPVKRKYPVVDGVIREVEEGEG